MGSLSTSGTPTFVSFVVVGVAVLLVDDNIITAIALSSSVIGVLIALVNLCTINDIPLKLSGRMNDLVVITAFFGVDSNINS